MKMSGMSPTKREGLILLGVISLLVVALVIAAPMLLEKEPSVLDPVTTSESDNSEIGVPQVENTNTETQEDTMEEMYPVRQALEMLEKQKQVDEQILLELATGGYTLETPLLVVDPYGLAPLTALAVFETVEPVQMTLHIDGKNNQSDVDFTFNEFRTSHQIPIYGLYADTINQVELTATNQVGEQIKKVLEVETAPLLEDLKAVTNVVYIGDAEKYSPGFNFMTYMGGIKYFRRALDINGDLRWLLQMKTLFPANYNGGRSMFVTSGNVDVGEVVIFEITFGGKILNVYASDFGAHHDIALSDRNTMLVTGSVGETIQDFIYEIDRSTGELLKTMDYKEVLQRSRVYGVPRSDIDWMHLNAIVYDGKDVISSSNYQSTITKHSINGEIKWMLADPTAYYTVYKQYLLTPVGTDFEYPYNQHAVDILPDHDNNPDTLDIILFDNGLSRPGVNPLYSRMVHYRINEKEMTVEQIWQYGKERPEIFSAYRSDANLLPNGNILGLFDVEAHPPELQVNPFRSTVYVEVNRDKDVIWECFSTSKRAKNFFADYRVERLPFYTEAANNQYIGIPANNLIPKEILSRHENP